MISLISCLQGVKSCGKDKWMALCPIHKEKTPSLRVSIASDSSVLAHCFGCGANGLDLYNHFELDRKELFGGKERQITPDYLSQDIQKEYEKDVMFCLIYESSQEYKTLQDQRSYKLSMARIEGTKKKHPNIKLFEKPKKYTAEIVQDQVQEQINCRDKFVAPIINNNDRDLTFKMDGTFTIQDLDNLRRIAYENLVYL